MLKNSSALSDAPPISPPSTSALRKQLARIAGLDAAAVEDRQAVRDFSILLRQPLPRMKRVHLLRLLRGWPCGRCRWPRPARRRSRRRRRQRCRCSDTTASSCRPITACVRPASRSASSSPRHRIGVRLCACAPQICGRPAHRPRRRGLRRSEWPDNDVAAAHVVEHRRRHLAGVGPVRLGTDILRAQPDRRCRAATARSPPGTRTAGRSRMRPDRGAARPGLPRPAARFPRATRFCASANCWPSAKQAIRRMWSGGSSRRSWRSPALPASPGP